MAKGLTPDTTDSAKTENPDFLPLIELTRAPDGSPAPVKLASAQPVSAGNFTDWLAATQAGAEADVACGSCNGCCKSFYFIHIEPDEHAALRHIPAELLFAAPGLPPGHRVMGHDEFGKCPMLIDERCSIYEHRPRTCRVYDCRLFAAANLTAGESDKSLINERARRWRFDDEEQPLRQALLAAADFLRAHQARFASGLLPSNASARALLVLRIHELFLVERDVGAQAAGPRLVDAKIRGKAEWVAGKVAEISAVVKRARGLAQSTAGVD